MLHSCTPFGILQAFENRWSSVRGIPGMNVEGKEENCDRHSRAGRTLRSDIRPSDRRYGACQCVVVEAPARIRPLKAFVIAQERFGSRDLLFGASRTISRKEHSPSIHADRQHRSDPFGQSACAKLYYLRGRVGKGVNRMPPETGKRKDMRAESGLSARAVVFVTIIACVALSMVRSSTVSDS